MKHKKDKKDKKRVIMQRQRTVASSSAADGNSAYRWEKLSPAEFEQLQDLASCKSLISLLFN